MIVFWHGKAYLPTQAKFGSGIFVDTEPVHVADLTVDSMIKAIQTVKDAGRAILPDPKSREEFIACKSPVLTATGARSWKQLAKRGTDYSIGWTENEIRIDMSRCSYSNSWIFPAGR